MNVAIAVPSVSLQTPLPEPTAPPEQPRRKRFTLREFEWMAEQGLITGRPELWDGEIIEMPPVGNALAVRLADIYRSLLPRWPHPKFIRSQATHRFEGE